MLDAPRIYRPVSTLADYTEIIGHWHAHVGYRSRALPRGAITLIIDVGRRQQLDFYAADGRTRLSVPPAFLTGSHTASYVSEMAADEPTMAVHFRPGGAFPIPRNAVERLGECLRRPRSEYAEQQIRWPRLAHDGPMDNTKHAVAATGLLVAAMRAEESARDDALFHDPFAERLAGDDGRRLLAESSSETGQPSAPIVVRTRLFDEALLGRTPTACRRW